MKNVTFFLKQVICKNVEKPKRFFFSDIERVAMNYLTPTTTGPALFSATFEILQNKLFHYYEPKITPFSF